MSVWKNVTRAGRIQIPELSFLENKSVYVGGMAYLEGVGGIVGPLLVEVACPSRTVCGCRSISPVH